MREPRGKRRCIRGVVVSDRAAKTITVRVTRHRQHPKYGKRVRQDRKIHAHDENDEARAGDVVEIVECRPMSRTKRWRLIGVIKRNPDQAVATSAQSQAEEAPAE